MRRLLAGIAVICPLSFVANGAAQTEEARPSKPKAPNPLTAAKEAGPQMEVSKSRALLLAGVRTHLDTLAAQVDRMDPGRRAAAMKLSNAIVSRFRPGTTLPVIVVCTGNSRRSIMGAAFGNASATNEGLNDIRFYSGGTEPSSFNTRTVSTLRSVGFEIAETGELVTAGAVGIANPIYLLSWGRSKQPVASVLGVKEFSKPYSHSENPQSGFIAVVVCDRADAQCPIVAGAVERISMPFADPKSADGTPSEAITYAASRDAIGTAMLFALSEARRRLESSRKTR